VAERKYSDGTGHDESWTNLEHSKKVLFNLMTSSGVEPAASRLVALPEPTACTDVLAEVVQSCPNIPVQEY
jgi:hypothetical protein